MPYAVTLAARLSQFGKTNAEFNLVDSDGVMPPTRASWTFDTLTPSAAVFNAARTTIRNNATAAYIARQNRLAREAEFIEQLSGWLDTKISTLREEYAAQVAASNLPQAAKDIANTVTFDWRLG